MSHSTPDGRMTLVADVSVVIRTRDEDLNDRMDAAICTALDNTLGDWQAYELSMAWNNDDPISEASGLHEWKRSLLMAAPDLYNACDDALNTFCAMDSITDPCESERLVNAAMDHLRTAIAKARSVT